MFKTICCLEVKDKLTGNIGYLHEFFESEDGYLEETNEDIMSVITAFNSESELRHEYEAIDVFCAIDEINNIIWETKY